MHILKQKPSIYVSSVGTAVPDFSVSQSETLDFILKEFKIKESTKKLYKKVFSSPSIEKRHFAINSLSELLNRDLDQVHLKFKKEIKYLSEKSLNQALSKINLNSRDLGFIATTTCTGYLCPGISSYLIESLNLKNDILTADLVGMGCGAALPALQQATHFLKANPTSYAAIVCTEICSAALYSSDDPDIVISNALFADGSAAAILSTHLNPKIELLDYANITFPQWRETLQFKTESGFLKNVLGKNVPTQSAEALLILLKQLLDKNQLERNDIEHWILHAGGKKVIETIQQKFSLSNEQVNSTLTILKNYGNLSSPSVLFSLNEFMEKKTSQSGFGVLSSFGAGFSAYGALIKVHV
ncbi:MAG: type III polyketide synthase [Elusimicrobiota bacterium]